MAAAPVESCRFVARRSPWGRFGSAVVACKRLHRMHRRFNHFWSISLSSPRSFSNFSNLFLPEPLGRRIDGVCGAGDYPLPDLPREMSRSRPAPEKSVQFGPDGAPFP